MSVASLCLTCVKVPIRPAVAASLVGLCCFMFGVRHASQLMDEAAQLFPISDGSSPYPMPHRDKAHRGALKTAPSTQDDAYTRLPTSDREDQDELDEDAG